MPRVNMKTDHPVKLSDFEELARKILPKMYYDYFAGGAEDEVTLRQNMEYFKRILLRPRVLVDVSHIDMSTSLLGYTMTSPIIVAPTGNQQMAHPEGELATARAAAACNTIMVLSFSSSYSIEEVASSCSAVRFYQLYVFRRREVTEIALRKAEKNGFKAIVLTVDTPRLGRREADTKNRLTIPIPANTKNLMGLDIHSTDGSDLDAMASQTLDPSLSWKDIDWLKSITKLPILLKGIVTAEDARKAVEIGVSGIIVSNHGGRQLDTAPATISVLEEVVGAVSGAVPVLLDGGIRRGTDAFKALALGAKAVMIGRSVAFGLAAKGETGVKSVITMLQNELELTMALAGCPTIKDITRNHVLTESDRFRALL